MQIKTTIRYHFTPVRMVIITKSINNKRSRECGEKGTLLHCWEGKLVQPLWRTVWKFLKKLNTELPYDPAIPLLGLHPAAAKLLQSRLTLCNPIDGSPPGSPTLGFSRQEHWSGLPFPPPGDLPDPRIKPTSPASPALAGGFFTTEPPGKPHYSWSFVSYIKIVHSCCLRHCEEPEN